MQSIQVVEGQEVAAGAPLGRIGGGDPTLQLVVLEGENRRDGGQGLLESIDVILAEDVWFADGFESGDTTGWSRSFPNP